MVRFVVMAAGKASRMGQDKLAMPWKDSTILGYTLETVIEAIASIPEPEFELRVIARKPIEVFASSDVIKKFYNMKGVWVEVPHSQPLADTIRAGLQSLREDLEYITFIPGDQVGIKRETLNELILCCLQERPDFLIPVSINGDVTGSPVFFKRQYFSELYALQGEQGGKIICKRYCERWLKIKVDPGFFADVDTMEQYNALRFR